MKTAIVIGAGITGVSSAIWLQRQGWKVILVDRIAPGDPGQTSYGNAGLLARNAVVPVSVPGLLRSAPAMLLDPASPLFLRWSYLPRLLPWLVPFLKSGRQDRLEKIVAALHSLTDDSVDQHRTLAEGTGAEIFIRTGEYAFLYKNRADFDHDALAMELRRTCGFTFTERDREALVRDDPLLGAAYAFAAVFRDHGWVTDPGSYVAALAAHLRASGGEIERGEVAALRPGTLPEVALVGGRILSADRVVLAAGAWSGRLAAGLGVKVPLETERGYHLFLKGVSHQPPFPYMIADAKFVVTPMEQGLRAAGLVEFGGLKAAASRAPLELLRRGLREVYPALTWQSEETWMGHRPTLPDSLPMLGETAGAPGIICAFGSQHVGLTIGARLGRIVADLAAGRAVNIGLEPFRTDRFT